MKKILFVLVCGIAVMSCTEADNKSDNNSSNAASTNSAVTANQSTPSTEAAHSHSAYVPTPPVDKEKLTKIEWLDGTNRDFGKMKEGEKLNVVFRFKNAGDKPLIIADVTAGCGCTATDKPTKPFAPGEKGEIKAVFNSEKQGTGTKSKTVNVFANTDPQMTSLTFSVEVKPKS